MQNKKLFALAIIAIIAAGALLYYRSQINSNNKAKTNTDFSQNSNTSAPITREDETSSQLLPEKDQPETTSTPTIQKPLNKIDYNKVRFYQVMPGKNGQMETDSKQEQLIAYYYDDQVVSVLNDLISTFPEIQNEFPNQVVHLRNLYTSYDKRKVVLETYLGDRYTPGKKLFVYDTTTGKLRESTLSNTLYQNHGEYNLWNLAAPEGTDYGLFAKADEGTGSLVQTLYLVNIFTDTMKVFVKLEGNDTLNAGTVAEPVFDILPYGERTVRVGIFNQHLKTANYNAIHDKGQSIVKTYIDYLLPTQ